jgi:uncharacterized repeat protein (TIGR02543 family)
MKPFILLGAMVAGAAGPAGHTATFNGTTADSGAMSPQTSATPAALTANGFTKTGYDFTGWNTDEDGSGTAYADGETYDFAADVTLYAQWAQIFTATFDGNGAGMGGMSPQSASAPTALTGNGFTNLGYNFIGWNTASDGSGTAYEGGATYAFDADVTLYAQWAQIFTVTFFGNGQDGGATDPQHATSPTALTGNGFTNTGFTFSGWNTSSDGSGTAYADGATYAFDADVTLYAQWETE